MDHFRTGCWTSIITNSFAIVSRADSYLEVAVALVLSIIDVQEDRCLVEQTLLQDEFTELGTFSFFIWYFVLQEDSEQWVRA